MERPILVVCAEKFSDKIGNVRTSRMIFGDGAAAIVVGVGAGGGRARHRVPQTYASGPATEVNSIIWPNPEFDNNITVYGPEVKSLVQRYLVQMIEELRDAAGPEGDAGTLLDSIDLIVPHQANKTMVVQLAAQAGLTEDNLYFNIAEVGNASSASIPLAIHDAVRDGVIKGRCGSSPPASVPVPSRATASCGSTRTWWRSRRRGHARRSTPVRAGQYRPTSRPTT